MSEKAAPGRLFLVPTPIGNLEDMTFRAVRVLKEADLIAAEDTRNSRKLLTHFGIHTPMTSYHEHNRFEKAKELVACMLQGKNLAVISDAGCPGISDPGEVLVRQAVEAGITVEALPGACAGITALMASGMDTKGFLFVGFLPREKKELHKALEALKTKPCTLILYEAPHRLKKTLEALKEALGEERHIALCRELTKVHEEYERCSLGEALKRYEEKEPRGEYVLVLEGCHKEEEAEIKLSIPEQMQMLLDQGMTEKEAMKETAGILGIPKRDVYTCWKLT